MKDMYNSSLLLYYKLCDNASEFTCLLRAPAQPRGTLANFCESVGVWIWLWTVVLPSLVGCDIAWQRNSSAKSCHDSWFLVPGPCKVTPIHKIFAADSQFWGPDSWLDSWLLAGAAFFVRQSPDSATHFSPGPPVLFALGLLLPPSLFLSSIQFLHDLLTLKNALSVVPRLLAPRFGVILSNFMCHSVWWVGQHTFDGWEYLGMAWAFWCVLSKLDNVYF